MPGHNEIIKKAREGKELTQRQLAESIGVTDTYITRIEKGYTRGSFNILSRIAESLGIPQDLLLKEAGFELPTNNEYPEFDSETYQFAQLPPKVKKFLLDCAPKVKELTES